MSTQTMTIEQVKTLVELAVSQRKYDIAVKIILDCIVSLQKEIEKLERTKVDAVQSNGWD